MSGPLLQITDGPMQLNMPGGGKYGASFTIPGPPPNAPFDQSKYEFWVHATGQEVVFDGQSISSLANLGVASTSCTDFVQYLKGKNGGPPKYNFDRFSNYLARVADRPDLFGTNPSIPGWATQNDLYVQFVGSTLTAPFQGVILRRWVRVDLAAEYWLHNRPGGKFGPGDTITFDKKATANGTAKELVQNFPTLMPDPGTAGPLSDYFFWYNELRWAELDADPDEWGGQICT